MEPLKDLNAALRYVEDNLREEINFQDISRIAQMWESLDERNIQQLKVLSNLEPGGLIQASINFDEGRMEEKGCLDHYIGIATTQGCPEVFAELKVQTGTWAVFTSVGPFPDTLQTTWGRIYAEWLPSSKYEVVPGPEILWTDTKDTASPDFHSEIWLPVRKRA